LTPLGMLAAETGVAVLSVRHMGKGDGANPLYRGIGSIGITAAARSSLVLAPHPDDPALRVLAVSKSNLWKHGQPSLLFSVQSHTTGMGNSVPSIQWEGASDLTARDVLAANSGSSLQKTVQAHVRAAAPAEVSPKEVWMAMGRPEQPSQETVQRAMERMAERDALTRTARGKYTMPWRGSIRDVGMSGSTGTPTAHPDHADTPDNPLIPTPDTPTLPPPTLVGGSMSDGDREDEGGVPGRAWQPGDALGCDNRGHRSEWQVYGDEVDCYACLTEREVPCWACRAPSTTECQGRPVCQSCLRYMHHDAA
jgi:hypothetical protein